MLNLKKLGLGLLLAWLAAPSLAAVTVGVSEWKVGTTTATSVTTTSATTQATGSTFVVYTVYRRTATGGTAPTSIVDSYSNTWVLGQTLAFAFGFSSQSVYYCINCTGGAGFTVTATWALAADLLSIALVEFKDLGAATLDVAPAGTDDTSGSPILTPSITTTVADEVVFGGFGSYSTNLQTIANSGAGFTLLQKQESVGGTAGAISWKLATSTGAQADSFSYTTFDYTGALSIAFKPASAPPTTNPTSFLTM